MNIAFWNTNRKADINKYLIKLIEWKNIDIMVLAEYKANGNELINELYTKNLYYNLVKTFSCNKINVIAKDDISCTLHDDNTYYISLKIERNNLNFQLFASHLSSNLHDGENERKIVVQEMKNDISKHKNALIMGDFNSNPFEESIVAFSGLHALPTKEKTERTVKTKKKEILYNPMWKFFGDFDTIPGTYFYNNSKDVNYYWNIFDQILLTHDFIKYLEDEKLEIIKEIKDINLIKNKVIDKNISDHLPIFVSLKEEY